MLARREPVTLRSLVAGTGVSTIAVYTYFDGMPGLWSALREEGFRRLAQRVGSVEASRDPVRDLAALGVAYAHNALSNPDLHRVMFDASFAVLSGPAAGPAVEPQEPDAASETFGHLVVAAQRSIDAGRFAGDADPVEVALRYWSSGHGIVSLTVTGALTVDDLRRHAPAVAAAMFVAAGDSPERARGSVRSAWSAWPAMGAQVAP